MRIGINETGKDNEVLLKLSEVVAGLEDVINRGVSAGKETHSQIICRQAVQMGIQHFGLYPQGLIMVGAHLNRTGDINSALVGYGHDLANKIYLETNDYSPLSHFETLIERSGGAAPIFTACVLDMIFRMERHTALNIFGKW